MLVQFAFCEEEQGNNLCFLWRLREVARELENAMTDMLDGSDGVSFDNA